MNRIQQTYAIAKAHYEAIKEANDQREVEFCTKYGYKTSEGNPAQHVWMIDDEIVFESANTEFCALNEQYGNDEIEAKNTLNEAEDLLINWGLSIVPASMANEREILHSQGMRVLKVREKLIDLAFRLDA